jgi:hypothetical protein
MARVQASLLFVSNTSKEQDCSQKTKSVLLLTEQRCLEFMALEVGGH